MSDKNPSELGTEPISSLLNKYAVPAIISMIVSSLYNIIDSIYIGHIPENGDKCITALAIAFPLMNLSAAFGSLVGAGGSTLVSIKLGEKDNVAANWVLGNVTTLNIIIGMAIMVLGLLFMDNILTLFGASADSVPGAGDGTISYAREFMTIILLGNTLTHLFFGLNNVMRASGNPNKAMQNTLLTVLLNIILAPVFIYVFGLGIAGAALATITAQTVSLVLLLYHFLNGKTVLVLEKEKLTLKPQIIKSIFSIGIAPFMLNSLACVVTVLMNNSFKTYGGDSAIGAYGIVNRVLTIGAMIVLGFNQGMQPIAGYNYGARKMDRVANVFKTTCLMATIVMVVLFTTCQLFPESITSIFIEEKSGEELLQMASNGLRIGVLAMPIVGFQMVTSNFFQSVGKAKISLFMSCTRQLLILVPMILTLPRFFGIDGVWFAMPASDFLASMVALIILKTQYKKVLQTKR